MDNYYRTFKNIRIFIAALLTIAIFDLPYGYYTFLRVVVCAAAAFGVYDAINLLEGAAKKVWATIFVLIAILFNPLVPVYLNKLTWAPIDLIVAVIFIISIFKVKKRRLNK